MSRLCFTIATFLAFKLQLTVGLALLPCTEFGVGCLISPAVCRGTLASAYTFLVFTQ